jgi:tRNA nucleotidyltransferase (CCA-adding enzyme)
MVTLSFSQSINLKAIEVCFILQNAGYQAYIVGGCVRDLYLGLVPKDWDICTNASPEEVVAIFPRTIPTGLKHGTITVCMGDGVENHFEVTTFRVEGEYLDGRRPEEVRFVKNVTEDLSRRDLTINAMAYDPVNHIGCDPFNGLQDIQDQVIRAVGDPMARFQEDGLRIMRVARFAARFGYRIEEQTMQGMKASLETLKKVSKERISDELCKTLMAPNPSYGMLALQASGALDIACPLLAGRQLPMFEGQYRCKGALETRLAFLYNKLPAKQVAQELIDLKMSSKEVKRVCFLLLTLQTFLEFQKEESALTYRHFIADIMNLGPDTLEHTLSEFIILAEALDLPAWELMSKHKDEEVFARSELQLNGNDLMAIGIKPGPQLKVLLDKCYLEILRNPEHNNKSYLMDLVKQNLDK